MIAHIADTHLRSLQHGRSYRGKDFFNAVCDALTKIASLGVKTVIHGGDLLDGRNPSSEVINQLSMLHFKCVELGLSMYVVTGNHDKCEPSWVDILNNVLKSSNQPSAIMSLDKKLITLEDGTTIYGLPFMNSAELKETLEISPEADFLVWHGAVKEFCDFPTQDTATIETFESCGKYKNVLLGDIHVHRYLPFGKDKTGIIGYPGSTELCEAGEHKYKYFSVISYGKNEPVLLERHEIKSRKVLTLRVTTTEDLDRVIADNVIPSKKEIPLIFVKYNPSVPECLPRIQAAMHQDSILRATPFKDLKPDTFDTPIAEEEKNIDSFLNSYISAEGQPELHNLAIALLNQSTKASTLITEYIDKQLQ